MIVKAKVELNYQAIAKLQESRDKVMPLLMEALKTEVENAQVIPRDHGDLMASSGAIVVKNTGYLTYNTVYARRLYFHPEYNFRKDKNMNARGRWLDDWIYGPKKDWITNTFMTMWKAQAGGVIK